MHKLLSTIKNLLRPRRGFNLIEAAIVLGIVGLIIGAIWVSAAAVYQNLRTSRATQQLLATAQNIRSLYTAQANLGVAAGTNLTASMLTAGVFPADMNVGGAVQNPWGNGAVVLAGTPNTNFDVLFQGVPPSACIDMLVRNTGAADQIGIIAAGGSNSGTATTFTNVSGGPVATVSTAATVCGSGTVSTVGFTFRLRG